jgi:WS/DGAT/MGAT family acyltransferase
MRMSDAEAIMWAVERDPALRSDFCNLTILDRRPERGRLLASLERALAAIPRLRQRVVDAPLRIVPPDFADDPDLDVASHLRYVTLPPPGDERALLDACAEFTLEPLDRDRPLWEFTLIDGLSDGRSALLQQVHHTVTDGVGGLRLSRALVDLEPDSAPAPPRVEDTTSAGEQEPTSARRTDNRLDVARAAVADATTRNLDAMRRIARGASNVFTHPTEVPGRANDAARAVASFQRQAIVLERARSDVMAERSLERRFEATRIPLEPARAAAHALGGTLNDLYIAALAGALGRYHARAGSSVAELRLAMPVSTRVRGDTAANRFVPVRVLVPIQPADDPATLFAVVRERLEAVKDETALSLAEGLAGVVSALPAAVLVAMTRTQTRTVDFAASNLRGSPVPLYLAGTRILGSFPLGPRTGAALNVTMLSYGDQLDLGLNIDPLSIHDPGAFMDDCAASFRALLEFAGDDLTERLGPR